jgi:E3 ubiquitin-protein ligase RAD18
MAALTDVDLFNVADSTDWLTTSLRGLAPVEAALRCQVCKDFYKTPMTTACAHTFCSLCIRRALASDGKCPLCRASDQESKLRGNHALEEVVDAFTQCRADTIKFAREASTQVASSPPRTLKRSPPAEESGMSEPKRLRRSARQTRPTNDLLSPTAIQPDVPRSDDCDEEEEDPIDGEYQEEPGTDVPLAAMIGLPY